MVKFGEIAMSLEAVRDRDPDMRHPKYFNLAEYEKKVGVLQIDRKGLERALSGKSTKATTFFSGGKLRKWYAEEWVPKNKADEAIPSREQELKAAKQACGDGVTRQAIRTLRKELAPESWRKRGRRTSRVN